MTILPSTHQETLANHSYLCFNFSFVGLAPQPPLLALREGSQGCIWERLHRSPQVLAGGHHPSCYFPGCSLSSGRSPSIHSLVVSWCYAHSCTCYGNFLHTDSHGICFSVSSSLCREECSQDSTSFRFPWVHLGAGGIRWVKRPDVEGLPGHCPQQ